MRHYFKYLLTMMALFTIMTAGAQTNKWRDIHKVKKGETIFGIAKDYQIGIQDLLEANPEMKAPGYELKKGTWIFVPFSKSGDQKADGNATVAVGQTVAASALTPKKKNDDGVIRVGVMLPLHNNDGDGKRMVEYYRGMLLAVNQLKAEGVNMEVNAWNVPIDADIRTTLLKDGVNNLNVVFGPLYSNMVKPLGDYCRANDIKMVIPFSITGDDVTENPYIYQVYQSPEELNNKAIAAFVERFPGHHPIFINCNDESSDKGRFTAGLRAQLDAKKASYNLTNVNTPQADFAKAFSSIQPNVVVVNTARSPQLNQVFAKLDSLKSTHPGLAISMFGYTEWFMYQRHDLAQFYKYSVYIPTTFYYNASGDRTKTLEKLYQDTYGEVMDVNGLPRYAITGYDQTMFFIRGLQQQGAKFEGKADPNIWKPVQTRLNFTRVGNGGYKNSHFQLIHFKADQTMESITY